MQIQQFMAITPNKLLAQEENMAARKWDNAQRAAQSAAIQNWQPWQHSTGAKSAEGKSVVSQNAYRGAMRPFLRLINTIYIAHMKQVPETLTLEYWEQANIEMDKLCKNDARFFSKGE
ncbi:MAG: hypothetical protein ACXW1W_09160 [Methylococcaceae bacterium]